MNARKPIPKYHTPPDIHCPECGDECEIIPLKNDFDYAGTHCTHGLSGTHYPNNWGMPVSSCCCVPMEDELENSRD